MEVDREVTRMPWLAATPLLVVAFVAAGVWLAATWAAEALTGIDAFGDDQ